MLVFDVILKWKSWNEEIKVGKMVLLGFFINDKFFVNNGVVIMIFGFVFDKFE